MESDKTFDFNNGSLFDDDFRASILSPRAPYQTLGETFGQLQINLQNEGYFGFQPSSTGACQALNLVTSSGHFGLLQEPIQQQAQPQAYFPDHSAFTDHLGSLVDFFFDQAPVITYEMREAVQPFISHEVYPSQYWSEMIPEHLEEEKQPLTGPAPQLYDVHDDVVIEESQSSTNVTGSEESITEDIEEPVAPIRRHSRPLTALISSARTTQSLRQKLKCDQGFKCLLRGGRRALKNLFSQSGLDAGKHHWTEEKWMAKAEIFAKQVLEITKPTKKEVAVLVILLYHTIGPTEQKPMCDPRSPVYQQLGDEGMTIFKKIFDNNTKDLVNDFFESKIIQKIWPKLLPCLTEETCFGKKQPNQSILSTYCELTKKMTRGFRLPLPVWWMSKFPANQ